MTEDELKAIRERADKATPGPWIDFIDTDGYLSVRDYTNIAICDFGDLEGTEGWDHDDAEFVAHARQDIPALVKEVERLQDRLHYANEAISAMEEWINRRVEYYCTYCNREIDEDNADHAESCLFGQVILSVQMYRGRAVNRK
jgi:hypothetical protein